jgi:1,4-alpha-glucan branching enzyme
MTPVGYEDYDIGVPYSGTYTEILNSEKDIYNGCNMCNFEPVKAVKDPRPETRFDYKIKLRIAPFGAVWMRCPKRKKQKN